MNYDYDTPTYPSESAVHALGVVPRDDVDAELAARQLINPDYLERD